MLYLSQMLGRPVLDSNGEEIGRISDLAIQTGEVFPRITSVAFLGPSKTPFMVSWRKYVASYEDGKIQLNKPSYDIRFSYLQPDELLLARDLLNKQIVDTQGLKVVRVNDLKFSRTGQQLRLLGAEVGVRGILRTLNPMLERATMAVAKLFRKSVNENIIAWSYMELVDRDLSSVKLAVTHKRLSELHPADVADILEQLDPQQRSLVFEHLDKQQAADTFSELEDEYQTDMFEELTENEAADLLAQMDPDDAADIIGGLPYEKAEKLLWLMGVQDEKRIRSLLGYKEKTAGGIMTPEFVAVDEDTTVGETIEKLRHLDEDHENVYYVYTLDNAKRLTGAVSLRSLVLADNEKKVCELAIRDLITVEPHEDQEVVADTISKYNLLAVPVVEDGNTILGIVTVDDALDVLEEEHSEDLQIAGAGGLSRDSESYTLGNILLWFLRKHMWFIIWALLAILATMSGNLPQVLPSLIFAPFVLLVANEMVAYAMNDLLEYGSADSAVKARRLFARNFVASLFVSIAAGILGTVLFAALGSSIELYTPEGFDSHGVQAYLILGFIPAIVAAFLTVIAGTLVTVSARRRLNKDKPISSISLTLLMMAFAMIVQIGLQILLRMNSHMFAWLFS